MEEFEMGFDGVEVSIVEEAAGPEERVVVGEEGEDDAEEEGCRWRGRGMC